MVPKPGKLVKTACQVSLSNSSLRIWPNVPCWIATRQWRKRWHAGMLVQLNNDGVLPCQWCRIIMKGFHKERIVCGEGVISCHHRHAPGHIQQAP